MCSGAVDEPVNLSNLQPGIAELLMYQRVCVLHVNSQQCVCVSCCGARTLEGDAKGNGAPSLPES